MWGFTNDRISWWLCRYFTESFNAMDPPDLREWVSTMCARRPCFSRPTVRTDASIVLLILWGLMPALTPLEWTTAIVLSLLLPLLMLWRTRYTRSWTGQDLTLVSAYWLMIWPRRQFFWLVISIASESDFRRRCSGDCRGSILPLYQSPMSTTQNCIVLVASLAWFITLGRVYSPMRSRK